MTPLYVTSYNRKKTERDVVAGDHPPEQGAGALVFLNFFKTPEELHELFFQMRDVSDTVRY